MKNIHVKGGLTAVFGLLLCCASVKAQGPAMTEYFLPGYNQRHWLNPALLPQFGYFNFPGAGMINVGVQGNLGLGSLLYPLENGKLGTFLHPDVPADEALKPFRKNNHLNVNADVSLLSWGWYQGTSFWSVDISAHVHGDVHLPYEAFEFLKRGMTGDPTEYHLKNIGGNAQAWASLALGHARAVTPEWHVGGKFKFLYSAVDLSVNLPRTDLLLSGDVWKAHTNGSGQMHGILQPTLAGDSISGFGIGHFGKDAGYGIAFDLGFEYRPNYVHGLRFSFALTDLGFIAYRKQTGAELAMNGDIVYEGMDLKTDGNGEMNFNADFGLEAEVPSKGYCRALFARMNAGVEYDFYLDMFSVGLLSSTYLNWNHVTTELTASVNMKLLHWLSLSVSYSFLKTRQSIGWALNITPKWGLNFFFASDYTPVVYDRINLDGVKVPMPARQINAQFMFGLSIPIGNNVLTPERGGTYEAWLIENGLYSEDVLWYPEEAGPKRGRRDLERYEADEADEPEDAEAPSDTVQGTTPVVGSMDGDGAYGYVVSPDEPTGSAAGATGPASATTGVPTTGAAGSPVTTGAEEAGTAGAGQAVETTDTESTDGEVETDGE